LQELIERDSWISVADRLPQRQKYVITITVHDGMRIVSPCFLDHNGQWKSEFTVTHWQPLPELPERASHPSAPAAQPPVASVTSCVPPGIGPQPWEKVKWANTPAAETAQPDRCAICGWPLVEGDGLNPVGCVRASRGGASRNFPRPR
jgi:hypothetical protein